MNNIKTTLLLATLTAILVVIGDMIGGRSGMIMMFVISMGMNFMSYWYSDKIVLAQYNAQPVTAQSNPKLYAMVEKLTKNGNLPMPRVYIIPSEVPNAFATGRNPSHAAVAVKEGIQRLLTDEELEGVLAHELTHVKNRDTLISTIAAMMAGAISMIANILQFTAIFGRSDDREGTNPLALLGTIIIAPIAAGLRGPRAMVWRGGPSRSWGACGTCRCRAACIRRPWAVPRPRVSSGAGPAIRPG